MIFNLVKKWTEGILPHEDVLKIPEKENKVKVLVAQSRLTLRDSMDCNHSGSSVQAKTLAAAAAAAVASVMSNSVRPNRQQPSRLPRPWDSPGKNTGVGAFSFI